MLLGEFAKLDRDKNGYLDVEELDKLAQVLLQERNDYDKLTPDQREEEKMNIFDEMDSDKSGYVSYHEVKVYLTRKMIAIHKAK